MHIRTRRCWFLPLHRRGKYTYYLFNFIRLGSFQSNKHFENIYLKMLAHFRINILKISLALKFISIAP